jgi:hypothetical protein
MKNAVFLDVTPCGSCKKRRFGGPYHPHHQGEKIRLLEGTLAITTNANFDPCDGSDTFF